MTSDFVLTLRELLAFAAFIAGVVAWNVRLEGMMKANKRETENLEQKVAHSEDVTNKKLEVMRQETNEGFTRMGASLERIIFRLADRNGNSDE